ncbi:ribokinase [Labrys miyagiensis]|uniref:Ribokinase n=1 Tax=Labrys miyagiensis TaxID=346912 RepID=A0ABQ6CHN8_9HYPH|nr:ribokinase [Labrys miyagiensis]GLS19147.1 ribokinase [Labrys miyagiensis]
MTSTRKAKVVVVGSLHYDIMVEAPDRPRKGETVTGYSWRPKFGGKGGNQAVAAAKANADVSMVGAVGDDDFGQFLLTKLQTVNINVSRVERLPGTGSGMSVAISDSSGDYGAVIVSGANLLVPPEAVTDAALWSDAGALILQNEMADDLNIAAARSARQAGVRVCLNAAPYRPLPPALSEVIDLLIVNAIEAEQLGGLEVRDLNSARTAAERLTQHYATVVVTAGGDGVAGCEKGREPIALEALPVELVSTHGAGDVFVGTLVSAIASGAGFGASLKTANDAAAAHVSSQPAHA